MKKISLFVEFDADFPGVDEDGDAGRIHNADYLATELSQRFQSAGISVADSDLWKDFGWYLVCNSLGADLDVLFAYYSVEFGGEDGWQLTVEPSKFPGLLSRLFGKKPTPYLSGMQKLALVLHSALAGSYGVRKLRYSLSTDVKKETDNPIDLSW
jgi:hypothetical protein